MAERKRYTITINGNRYPISTEEPEEYVRKIEYYLNSKIQNAKDKTGMHYSDPITLTLLSIDLCDEYFKSQEQFDRLKTETDKLLEKFDEMMKALDAKDQRIAALEDQLLRK